MKLTDAELVALYVAAEPNTWLSGADYAAGMRACRKLEAEMEQRGIAFKRRAETGTADALASTILEESGVDARCARLELAERSK